MNDILDRWYVKDPTMTEHVIREYSQSDIRQLAIFPNQENFFDLRSSDSFYHPSEVPKHAQETYFIEEGLVLTPEKLARIDQDDRPSLLNNRVPFLFFFCLTAVQKENIVVCISSVRGESFIYTA